MANSTPQYPSAHMSWQQSVPLPFHFVPLAAHSQYWVVIAEAIGCWSFQKPAYFRDLSVSSAMGTEPSDTTLNLQYLEPPSKLSWAYRPNLGHACLLVILPMSDSILVVMVLGFLSGGGESFYIAQTTLKLKICLLPPAPWCCVPLTRSCGFLTFPKTSKVTQSNKKKLK